MTAAINTARMCGQRLAMNRLIPNRWDGAAVSIAPSVSDRSCAEENRSSGRFSRHLETTLASVGGTPGAADGDRLGILLEDRRGGLDAGRSAERSLPGQHLVEDDTEGEDVRAVIGGLALHLLGRHVGDGAEQATGSGIEGRRRGLGREIRLGQLRAWRGRSRGS